MRWQLDGWLRGGPGDRPSAGIDRLRLDPEEIVDGQALQLRLWQAAATTNSERAARAMVRVQGLLGPEAVVTAVLGGGRGPADRVRLVPWGDERTLATDRTRPWPGRLPAPSPASCPGTGGGGVLDAMGTGARHRARRLTARPATVTMRRRPARGARLGGAVAGGRHWWAQPEQPARPDAGGAGRRGPALALLLASGGNWTVEGVYD